MSDPWPGRVLADHPETEWPGKVVQPSAVAEPDAPKLRDRNAYFDHGGRGKDLNVRSADAPIPLPSPVAVDGDTIRSNASRVRVWGADAPELHQQGWNRQSQPVPIGEQSHDWLNGSIANAGGATLGGVKGESYARLVGPVTLGDGQDVALSSIRSGNAMAAPSYVQNDPAYRFKLMEAERLARLNRLGPMNDNYVPQTPAQYRNEGPYVPERETVPVFFDTPTPFAGMRPEAEREYVGLLRSGKADQIYAFGTAQGFGMDRKQVEEWVAARDKAAAKGTAFPVYPNYQQGPKVIQDVGEGAFNAGVRSYANEFLAGGLDEAGAVADTLGGTPGRENIWNSDRRLADIWANNQWQNSSILGGDAYAHPTATTVGGLAGGLTQGVVIPYGRGARTAWDLGKVGLAYGAAHGFLSNDGSVTDRLKGAAIEAPVGMIANAGLGKALEYGAPPIGAGARRVFGRDATRAAETAGEVAGEYADNSAQNAAQGVSAGTEGDVWPGRVVDSQQAAGGRAGWEEFRREGNDRFLIYHGPEGQQANVHVAIGNDGVADISVDPFSKDANRFGPGIVRQAARDLKELYPEIKAFRGERESGANPGRVQSMAMDGEPMPSLSAEAPAGATRPRPLLDPTADPERMAVAERIQPRDVLPVPSNAIESPEEAAAAAAGRYVEAKAPNERADLSRGSVRAWNGAVVPKVGPTDLVGWLRLRGGLKDQGGELSHMGLTNKARTGLDHVGQEARFGPLVNNESGSNFDDAALAAWEAGFFPEHTERPSINDFLDALRDTHNGGIGRRFNVDDQAELERFEAMRAERYDLEQREHEVGGPVYADRSVPANEPQPFAPISAYEDTGNAAPDFAGNIRLDKLDSPQDIARALVQTERNLPMDAATRGKVTHAETERLASELGMTADQLLARRKGQAFNAEEALAARQILAKSGNELVNAAKRIRNLGDDPGSDALADFRAKWVRHAAIQEQVSGMTAEAGRALQQFRQLADSREVRGDVLASMVAGGGGAKRLKEAADILLDAVESGPGVFNTVADKALKPKWRDKIAEWYVNALLGWPATHIVNITSNTLTAIAQIPEHAVGAAIGGMRQAFRKDAIDRVTGSEVGARAFGLLQGAREGARLFAQALRTGEGSDLGSKVEAQGFKAIDGKLGEVVRVPTRFLTAEDELFKGIARRMELNGQAVRIARDEGLKGDDAKRRISELVADPTDEMFQRALDYGRYVTFQQRLGPTGQKIAALSNDNLALKVLLPFVRTPTNLLKFAVERSPAAPMLKEWRADILAGGARRDVALARMMVGTGFGFAMYQAANTGAITGSAPSDPKKARLLYADGWKPYSIKIGNTYYSYKRLDPFSTTIGVAADLATLPEGMSEKQREDKATLLVASIMGNLASKTWLSGASSFIEAITDPERYAGDFKNRLVASFLIPNVIRGAANALDPVARKPETFGEELQSRIPGLRDNLTPRRDVWGREIRNEGGLGPDAFSPVWISTALNDPVNHELMQLDYAPGYPSKAVGGRQLSPDEYDRYLEAAGKGAHAALTSLVTSPWWKSLDDEAKVKAAAKAVTAARKEARVGLFGDKSEHGEEEWPGKVVGPSQPVRLMGDLNGEQWPGKPVASRDVMGDLQRAIPGIQFTSGYRSPEYNASLKARGYHPAKDSEHLDGSALDMLPPRGKSLSWLLGQVKRYDPTARLLVHDGHLHAGFNGYYAAPAIGGAKSAGLMNANRRGLFRSGAR